MPVNCLYRMAASLADCRDLGDPGVKFPTQAAETRSSYSPHGPGLATTHRSGRCWQLCPQQVPGGLQFPGHLGLFI